MKKSRLVICMMLGSLCLATVGCTKHDDDDDEWGGNGGGGLFGHEYVDLGLPSGTLWATCNVGATIPEEYGDYFAWGETTPKDTFNWNNYKYGDYNQLTKYCNNSAYGYNGFTDNLTTLQSTDDAATVNWGTVWRMPTIEEFEELCNNTTFSWPTQNGVDGLLFSASNGKSIFLPIKSINSDDERNDYWSRSLDAECPNCALTLIFRPSSVGVDGDHNRSNGFLVRPVRSGN